MSRPHATLTLYLASRRRWPPTTKGSVPVDEFELEITPLRPRIAASPVPLGGSDAPRPADPLARSHPHRRLRAVAAVLAVLLTGVLIIAASPGPRAALVVLLYGTPTPTAPLPFGANIMYFEHAVQQGECDYRRLSLVLNPATDR
jgi:hypothetical protein